MKTANTKTALVTGAASGIGFELSLLLAKDSYSLILVDIDGVKLEQSKNHLQKVYNSQIITLVRDLSKPNVSQEIFDTIEDYTIDILINNAGFGVIWCIFKYKLATRIGDAVPAYTYNDSLSKISFERNDST